MKVEARGTLLFPLLSSNARLLRSASRNLLSQFTPGQVSNPTDQQHVIEFLSDPGNYGPDTNAVERYETHGSIVFLAVIALTS